MRPSLPSSLAAALLIGLPAATIPVAVTAQAQSRTAAAPEIDALQVNADRGLAPGSTLRFTVRGTPGGQARVQVQGTGVALSLQEGARGVYSGSYTIRPGDRIDPANLIRASLAASARTTIANYSFPPAFVALANAPAPRPAAPQPQARPEPPVQAQAPATPPATAPAPALRIDRFAAAPVPALEPGAELRFSLDGAPGASASFELPGIASNLPMRELRPGHYEGSYTLRRQDKLAPGLVVATLRSGERWITARLAGPLATDTAGPVIGTTPQRPGDAGAGPGTTVVFGTFDDAGGSGVDPRSVRLTIAGRDVTAETLVTPQSFSYRGALPPGSHTVEVTARDLAGNTSQKTWIVEVGTAMGAAAATTLPLQLMTPGAGARGNDVVIQGRTAPGASVRVQVDAIAPQVDNRVSVAQRVNEQTVTAGPDGIFSVNLGSYRAVEGTRFEVSLVASQGGLTAEQRLVLAPRPG